MDTHAGSCQEEYCATSLRSSHPLLGSPQKHTLSGGFQDLCEAGHLTNLIQVLVSMTIEVVQHEHDPYSIVGGKLCHLLEAP